jgi:putative hydrolase of the HAD superfamily
MNNILKWLENLEELKPEPSGISPQLNKIEGIKAVIFDIYGTLLVSASDDVEKARTYLTNLRIALVEAGYLILKKQEREIDEAMEFMLRLLVDNMKRHHFRRRKLGVKFSEVNIRQIWLEVINMAVRNHLIAKTSESKPDNLAIVFDLLCNKIYPMPLMKEVILQLENSGKHLGIISNAQFYSPIQLNYFLEGKIAASGGVEHFDQDLLFFSYQYQKAKPDFSLFDRLLTTLKKNYGILPFESVYVGNDMFKDIFPARHCGMKTVLFAGDRRSLRLRQDRTEVAGLIPDAIITELRQLPGILSLSVSASQNS